VSDHDDLRSIAQRYSRAADARDIDELANLFEPDAVIAGARGTQHVDEWLDSMRGPRAFPTSMHLLGDPLIELDDEAGTATTDTYAVVYQLSDPASGNADLTLGMRYVDELVRRDGGWRIARRTTTTLWMR
jgi:hypothetical protein